KKAGDKRSRRRMFGWAATATILLAIAVASPTLIEQGKQAVSAWLRRTFPGGGPVIPTGQIVSNGEILKNIVLASRNEPLNFDKVIMTGTFMNGFLSPVSLHDLNYFIGQGHPRELLFWLFIDSFAVTIGDRVIGFQYNPPEDYGCPVREPKQRCFREFIEIATLTGLSVEAKVVRGSRGKSADGEAGGADSSVAREYSRFCFAPDFAERAQRAMARDRLQIVQAKYIDEFLPAPVCESAWTPGQADDETDTKQFAAGPLVFKARMRSTNGIYQFLGKVLNEQIRASQPSPDKNSEIRAYLPP